MIATISGVQLVVRPKTRGWAARGVDLSVNHYNTEAYSNLLDLGSGPRVGRLLKNQKNTKSTYIALYPSLASVQLLGSCARFSSSIT